MATKDRDQSRSERAAAIRAEQQRKERRQRAMITVGVLVVIVAIITAVYIGTRGGSSASADSTSGLDAKADGNTLVVGNNPSAKTKVTIYEDFLCPFCRQFETSSRDYLRTDAKDGKVLVTYKPFQLLQPDYSKQALNAWSAVLLNGSGQQALKFHDALYDNQPYEDASSFPSNDDLKKTAKDAGVTSSSVLDKFDTENTSFYSAVQKAAKDQNVTGTPTIFVNGKQLQGKSIDDLVSNLEKQIAAS